MKERGEEETEESMRIVSRFLNSVIRLTALIVVVHTHQEELDGMYNEAAYKFAHDLLLFLKERADEFKSLENALRLSKTFIRYVDYAYNVLLSTVENAFELIYGKLPTGMSQATEAEIRTTINLDAYFRPLGNVAEQIYPKYYLEEAREKLLKAYESGNTRVLMELYGEYARA